MISQEQLKHALIALADQQREIEWDSAYDCCHRVESTQKDLAPLLIEFLDIEQGTGTMLYGFILRCLLKIDCLEQVPVDKLVRVAKHLEESSRILRWSVRRRFPIQVGRELVRAILRSSKERPVLRIHAWIVLKFSLKA